MKTFQLIRKEKSQEIVPTTLKKENMLALRRRTRPLTLQREASSFFPLHGEHYVLLNLAQHEVLKETFFLFVSF